MGYLRCNRRHAALPGRLAVSTADKWQAVSFGDLQIQAPIPDDNKPVVGNIYCAHCGNRLTLTTSSRNKRMPYEPYRKKYGHSINVTTTTVEENLTTLHSHTA
ncbi:hypothetical protein SDC9_126172 [bioreactor metagenome]|uniref:Uncharacterized protein n=1 Tax=bioreactor metagenome TaxID=1076179 RepID=A0A645CQG4_9ZZZZ